MAGALGISLKIMRELGLFSLENVPGTPYSTFRYLKEATRIYAVLGKGFKLREFKLD